MCNLYSMTKGQKAITNNASKPVRDGTGRALLVHAEELARSLRLEEVRLYTNGSFTTTLSSISTWDIELIVKRFAPNSARPCR